MKIVDILFCVLCIYLFILPEVRGFDLVNAVNSGLLNNYDLKVAKENLVSARLESKEKHGYFTPTISFSGYQSETEQLDPFWSHTTTDELTATLTQPLYDPSLSNNVEEAAINEQITRVRFQEIKEKITLNIVSTVFKVYGLIAQHSITNQSLKFIEKNVVIQKKLLAANYRSRIDLLEAETELARYQKEFRDITSKLELELLNLSQVTQIDFSLDQFPTFKDLPNSETSEGFNKDYSYWVEAASRYNSQLSLVRLKQQQGRLNRKKGQDNLKPRVDLSFIHSITEDDSVSSEVIRANEIKLSFSISFTPISSYYQILRLDSAQSVLELEEKRIIKELEDQIRRLIETLATTEKKLNLLFEWISKQKETIELYQKGLEKQHFPVSKILEISRKHNESLLELSKSHIEIWEIESQIFHLSGLLDKKAIAYFSKVIH